MSFSRFLSSTRWLFQIFFEIFQIRISYFKVPYSLLLEFRASANGRGTAPAVRPPPDAEIRRAADRPEPTSAPATATAPTPPPTDTARTARVEIL